MRKGIVSLLFVTVTLLCASRASGQAAFLRGDSNHDKVVDISDGIGTLGWLFLGAAQPPCLDAADINDSGEVDIADGIYTFNYLFTGGSAPAAPFPVFEADPTADGLGCLGPCIEISANITADTTWTSNSCYILMDTIFVEPPATLTIEAGTTVQGKKFAASSTQKPTLVVLRGAKIHAVGTATHPVVFTSESEPGNRKALDWGGVVLLGQSELNIGNGVSAVEGLPDLAYGCPSGGVPPAPPTPGATCPVLDDSSGTMSYCRIEFGGFPLFENNEVNALSVFACGSGTQLDHIQVKFNADDGFEWFGGNASLKYGLVQQVEDDMFDYSYGFRGNGQFWVGIEDGRTSDAGFEVDNSEAGVGNFTDEPRTMPTISNVTLIGTGDPVSAKGGAGFVLRRGAGTRLYNFIMQGFKVGGLDLDDATTCDMLADQPDGKRGIVLDYGVFFDNGSDGLKHWVADSDEGTFPSPCSAQGIVEGTATGAANNIQATSSPTKLTKPYDLLNPDFTPQNDALGSVLDPTSLGAWFSPATYRGGVAPDTDWTKEPWVSYAQD